MGAGLTYTLDVGHNKIVHGQPVWFISSSTAFNIIQLSVRRPIEYLIYDARPRKAYLTESPKNAIWAWEKNADFRQQEDYHQFLRGESDGRTIMLFADKQHPNHCVSFVNNLVKSGSNPKRMVIVEVGMKAFKSVRYKDPTCNKKWRGACPLEIIAPASLKTRKGPAIFAGASSLLSQYRPALKHFGISVIVNVSREHIVAPDKVDLVKFLSTHKSPDFVAVAECLKKHVKKRESILILDDTGNDYSMGCIAALLCYDGHNIDAAIEFLRSKNYHSDNNHLHAVYALLPAICTAAGLPPPSAVASPPQPQSPTTPRLEMKDQAPLKDAVKHSLSSDDDFLEFKPMPSQKTDQFFTPVPEEGEDDLEEEEEEGDKGGAWDEEVEGHDADGGNGVEEGNGVKGGNGADGVEEEEEIEPEAW